MSNTPGEQPPGAVRALVKLQVGDGVATITLDRPEAHNSLNPAMLHQLRQAVDCAVNDSSVRGIVVCGHGPAFLAGADLAFFCRNVESGDGQRLAAFTQAGQEVINVLDRAPQTVVAAVHGAVLGAGLELALACDWIVAAEGASFSFPETGLGICPGLGGTQRAPRAIGDGLARWMIYSGASVGAVEAREIGLADEVVAPQALDAHARQAAIAGALRPQSRVLSPKWQQLADFFTQHRLAELLDSAAHPGHAPPIRRAIKALARRAPLALTAAEELVDLAAERPLDEGLRAEAQCALSLFGTEDARAGLAFAVQKRLGYSTFVGR